MQNIECPYVVLLGHSAKGTLQTNQCTKLKLDIIWTKCLMIKAMSSLEWVVKYIKQPMALDRALKPLLFVLHR